MDLQTASFPPGNLLSAVDSLAGTSALVRATRAKATTSPALTQREATETLIPDTRAELSPAQSVERKLTSMLRGGAIPVSHIRLARLCGKR